MSVKRQPKAWWGVCLTAVLCAPPLLAAEAGAVSRAVEVAPPKGWTPDMPLFQAEPSASLRQEVAPQVPKGVGAHAAVRRSTSAGGRDSTQPAQSQVKRRAGIGAAVAPQKVRARSKAEVKPVLKASAKAQGTAGAARSAKAGQKPSALAPRVASKRGADRQAAKRADRLASAKRSTSASKSAGAAAVRATKTPQANGQARLGVREPTVARRAVKRVKPGAERGERAGRQKKG